MMKSARLTLLDLNWPVIALVALIAGLGIYNLHSASAAHEPLLYLKQVSWLLVGGAFAAILLFVDYRFTEQLAYVAYGAVCCLLVAVLAQGRVAGGAQRWLQIGPAVVQPSEFAKIATVLCLARYFGQRTDKAPYSFASLVRPFNPSRPLAALALVILSWTKPLLGDPVGESARAIRRLLAASPPSVGDLLWFRALLIILGLVLCALTLALIVRTERSRALLDPWPPKRRNRLIVAAVLFYLGLLALLIFKWQAATLRDPFGVLIVHLFRGAAPGGRYAMYSPSLTLRVVLVGVALLYLASSVYFLRRLPGSTTDVLIAPIDLLALPGLLVLVQPDLGTAGIIIFVGMSMILVVGVRLKSLLIMGLLSTVVAGIGWFGVLKDYQKRRILTFIDPEHDIMGAGWNAVQSLIAVGSGRWFGKGHMEGTQSQLSFLPEQHTDFAFSVWAEEQGFIGCVLLLALYMLLLWLAIAVAAEARESYGALLAVGVAAIIFWQAFINVGMVIGMMPVVGLTLPLFSYGGSSVMTVMVGLGLLLNVHWRRRSH